MGIMVHDFGTLIFEGNTTWNYSAVTMFTSKCLLLA
jgi:hypothetical protein